MIEKEKGGLIKEALRIVDELATLDVSDDSDKVEKLIEKSVKLKENRLWKLN